MKKHEKPREWATQEQSGHKHKQRYLKKINKQKSQMRREYRKTRE